MEDARKDHLEFCDEECRAEAEIRGGNRPSDYIPEVPVAHEDHELEDGAESQ